MAASSNLGRHALGFLIGSALGERVLPAAACRSARGLALLPPPPGTAARLSPDHARPFHAAAGSVFYFYRHPEELERETGLQIRWRPAPVQVAQVGRSRRVVLACHVLASWRAMSAHLPAWWPAAACHVRAMQPAMCLPFGELQTAELPPYLHACVLTLLASRVPLLAAGAAGSTGGCAAAAALD